MPGHAPHGDTTAKPSRGGQSSGGKMKSSGKNTGTPLPSIADGYDSEKEYGGCENREGPSNESHC